MNSHWNSKLQRDVYILQPSNYYLTQKNELINTLLGSCVAVCLRDIHLKIGGMNHFLLPSNTTGTPLHWPQHYDSNSLRYGDISMSLLINELIKKGAKRENFEAKIFGGGAVLPTLTNVGADNIRFVKEYLALENIPISAEDVGGTQARKIYYDVLNGDVLRMLIPESEHSPLKVREHKYLTRVNTKTVKSDTYFLDDK